MSFLFLRSFKQSVIDKGVSSEKIFYFAELGGGSIFKAW